MQLHIAKWGNSLALRLPRHLAQQANLTEGTAVTVEARDGAIVLTPVRKRFKLSELLADMPEKAATAEVDWGRPEGDEPW